MGEYSCVWGGRGGTPLSTVLTSLNYKSLLLSLNVPMGSQGTIMIGRLQYTLGSTDKLFTNTQPPNRIQYAKIFCSCCRYGM